MAGRGMGGKKEKSAKNMALRPLLAGQLQRASGLFLTNSGPWCLSSLFTNMLNIRTNILFTMY